MTIELNGESRELAKGMTVVALVHDLGFPPEQVAVERNRTLVRRREWAETRLEEGDKVEVVHFVGGG